MRPQSIRYFDYLFLGGMVLGILNTVFSFGETMAIVAADPATQALGDPLVFIVFTLVFSFGINLLLWFFISRKKSTIAKWILVVFMAIGVLGMPSSLATLSTIPATIAVVITLIQLAAIIMLFRADAKAWFASKGQPEADASVFE